MKALIVLVLMLVASSHASSAMSCSAFVSSQDSSWMNALEGMTPEDEFEHILMASRSLYEKSTFDFAVEKYEKYQYLSGLELNDSDLRSIMVLFLNHSYTHLPKQLLALGQKALERVEFESLSEKEKISLALTYLHPKETRLADKAIDILEAVNTVQAYWHQAEVFYMLEAYPEALRKLNQIREAEQAISSKTQEAVDAVTLKIERGLSVEERIEIHWRQAEAFKARRMYKEALEQIYKIEKLIGEITPEVKAELDEIGRLLFSGTIVDTADDISFDITQWREFVPAAGQ